ncbi:MAG: Rnf-Nqr domain containing protein [Oscillospiraceae bacterium]|nr:Rnf-Nqr domain containing protein [Oscillospiraceae bacterium]
MKKEHLKYIHQHMDRIGRRDRVFLNNPVVMQGIGLTPVVAAAVNLQNAAVLSMMVILMLTLTRVLAALICRTSFVGLRAVIYTSISTVVYLGAVFVTQLVFGGSLLQSIGIYLPLLIIDPIIIKRYVRPQKEKVSTALYKGVLTTVGFVLVILLVGALRELLGTGTLFGFKIFSDAPIPIAQMAAGGFIVMGLVAAIWRSLANLFKKHVNMGVKKL